MTTEAGVSEKLRQRFPLGTQIRFCQGYRQWEQGVVVGYAKRRVLVAKDYGSRVGLSNLAFAIAPRRIVVREPKPQ